MNVSVIGFGIMGQAAVDKLFKYGYSVTVYSRQISKLKDLDQKIAVTDDINKAFGSSEVIILFLPDASSIKDCLAKVLNEKFKNKTVVQMGTISPNESIALLKMISGNGGEYFECPVLGSRREIENSSILMMVGATRLQFDRYLPLLNDLGRDVYFVGDVGKAAALKLAFNQIIASHAVTFSLSLGIVERNGVDKNIFSDILRKSSLYAPMYDKKIKNWESLDFSNPNFPIKHLLKDVNLIIDNVKQNNINEKSLEVIIEILKQAMDNGLQDQDYSSMYKIINKIT